MSTTSIFFSLARCAVFEPYRPILVNLVVTRRCNLSCSYCHEYDRVSPPVPFERLEERLDHLARLRTIFVTLTGGETLLHPRIVDVVGAVKTRGMTPLLNTNGYLVTRELIEGLGRAGLYGLQISIDNVRPDAVSKKSLVPLLPRLRLLAAHATFRVRVNSVLGPGRPEEAVEVARAALALGFDAKCSLARDANGALIPLDDAARRAYDEIVALGRRSPGYLSEDFQRALLDDGRVDWKCRAGARTFHVCEDGLVHVCPANWGKPGVPLAGYGRAHLERAFRAPKPCAPTCTQAYSHQTSRLDALRSQAGQPLTPPRVSLPVLRAA